MLAFDSKHGCWVWEIYKINRAQCSDNVVDLLVLKIKRLTEEVQSILKLASCIGNKFDLNTLIKISGNSTKEISDTMIDLTEAGLVLPLDSKYQFASYSKEDANAHYKFIHDKVQQAAYFLIDECDRPETHLRIARTLTSNFNESVVTEKSLDIISHYKKAVNLIKEHDEKIQIAKLCLTSGKLAKRNIAYGVALENLKFGVKLLPSNSWQTHYDLIYNLTVNAAEAAFATSRADDMEAYNAEILKNGATNLDKIIAYEIQISFYNTQSQYDKAVDIGLKAISTLGFNLNKHPSKGEILKGLLSSNFQLKLAGENQLRDLPIAENIEKRKLQDLLNKLITSAYFSNNIELSVIITFALIKLTLKYGFMSGSIQAFTGFGIILISKLNKIEQGYKYGDIAAHLYNRLDSQERSPRSIAAFYAHIIPWKHHLKDTIDYNKESIQTFLNIADYEYVGLMYYAVYQSEFLCGKNLNDLEKNVKIAINFLKKINNKTFVESFKVILLTILDLKGLDKKDVNKYKLNHYNSIIKVEEIEKETPFIKALLSFMRLNSLYIKGMHLDAEKILDDVLKFNEYFPGQRNTMPAYYYSALVCASVYSKASNLKKSKLKKRIISFMKKLKYWAKYSPMNALHRYELVYAEVLRIENNIDEAGKYYDLSIRHANENSYVQEAAIANELAAKFYLGIGKPKIAKVYMLYAYKNYESWGALVKTDQLVKDYPELLFSEDLISFTANEDSLDENKIITRTFTTSSTLANLNLLEITDAIKLISKQLELKDVFDKILAIVFDHVNVTKCCILIERNGEWLIEAQKIKDKEVEILKSISFKERVSDVLIHNMEKTYEIVLLDNPAEKREFENDHYIQSEKPKSLLAIPILIHENLSGILYLENKDKLHAFNPKDLEFLRLILGQVAVSIENALYYKKILDLNIDYERFVPKEFLQLLDKKNLSDVKLGDQVQKEMPIGFCSINNFRDLTSEMSPKESFAFLNKFLSVVAPLIYEEQGFIDKYLGDGFMVLFPGGADSALRASIAILNLLNKLNNNRVSKNLPEISFGIGLNTGKLILGTVGDSERVDGTVISDTVNSAARIEELTKFYNVSLLISDSTLNKLKNKEKYSLRKISESQIRGKEKTIVLYEVFDADNDSVRNLKLNTKEKFETGIDLYINKQYSKANKLFGEILAENSQDDPSRIYTKLIENEALKK